MADKPTDTTGEVTAEQLGSLINLTPRRVRQLAAEGVIPRGSRGRYPLAAGVRGYIVFLQLSGGGAETIDPDKLDPFRRRAHYQAELEKIEIRMKAGELIPRAEVERQAARVFDVLARYLDVLPDRLERAGLVGPDVAERIVEWTNATRHELHAQVTTDDDVAAGAV